MKRCIDRCSRRELADRQALHHLLERERIVSEQLRVLLDVPLRRLDRLAVVVERLRLAEARDAGLPQLDDEDVLGIAGAARDDERFRQLERDDPRGDLHGRNVPTDSRR